VLNVGAVLASHPCIYSADHGVGKSMRQVKRETRGERRGQMISADDVFDNGRSQWPHSRR
jgi:hypothetical protein